MTASSHGAKRAVTEWSLSDESRPVLRYSIRLAGEWGTIRTNALRYVLDAMNFNIERRDIELESTFSPRLWSLVHDGPVLYDALLERLAHVGLSGMDLRPEAGNGSVGTTGLEFWLFGNKVNVQLRLDSFRFRTSSLASDVLDSADGVVAAIRQALPDELRFRTHAVSYACHGLIEGMKAAELVGGIVGNAPVIEGFGGHLGTGVAFYFRRGSAYGQLHVDPGCVTGGARWPVRQCYCSGGRVGWNDSGDTGSCGGARPDDPLVRESGDSVKMPMSGQQLGGPANAAPSVPEFLVEDNSGSVLSQIERAGFSEDHVDFSTVGGITSRSALRAADVFGFQLRPRFSRRPRERGSFGTRVLGRRQFWIRSLANREGRVQRRPRRFLDCWWNHLPFCPARSRCFWISASTSLFQASRRERRR